MSLSSSSSVEQAAADLKNARLVVNRLGNVLVDFQPYAFSILSLSEQLRSIEGNFAKAESSISNHAKQLESKLREVGDVSRRVESLQQEVELKQRRMSLVEKSISWRVEAVEVREKDVRERCEALELEKMQINEQIRALKFKEKQFEARERRIDERCRLVEERERQIDEQCNAPEDSKERKMSLDLREMQLNERARLLELKEMEMNEGLQSNREELLKEAQIREAPELKEAQIREAREALTLKEEQMDEQLKEFDLKEKKLNACCEMLELKEKMLRDNCRELELKVTQMKEQSDELELRLELKEKQLEEQCEKLKLKEKEINECYNKLGLKEKEVEDGRQALDMKEKEINERYEKLGLKEKEVEDGRQSLDMKEKEIDECYKKLGLKEKDFEDGRQALDSKEKEINDRCLRVEMKEKQLSEQSQAMEAREKQLNEALYDLELKTKQVNDSCGELERRKKEISKLQQAMEAKEKENNDHGRMLELKKKEVDEHQQALEVKENKLNEDIGRLKSEAEKIDHLYEQLKLKEKEIHEHFQAMEAKKKQIDEHYKGLELREKELNELRQALELKEKQINGMNEFSQAKDSQEANNSFSSSGVTSLCRNMDAKGLRSYLIKHVEELDKLHEDILNALRLAQDPAKLVLDVCRSFPKSNSSKFCSIDDKSTACIFLLDLLMKLAPTMTAEVKVGAKNYATSSWRARLKKNVHADVLAFLMFLTAFELASSFKLQKLFKLFLTLYSDCGVYLPELHRKVCDALGITSNIPGHINHLIQSNTRLKAVNFICAFKMEHHFPPIPLLQAHVEFVMQNAEKMRKSGANITMAETIRRELLDLRAVLKCISDFKLKSEFSSILLRIQQLEEGKATVSNIKQSAMPTSSPNSEDKTAELVKSCGQVIPKPPTPVSLEEEVKGGVKRRMNVTDCVAAPEWQKKRPRVELAHQAPPFSFGQATRVVTDVPCSWPQGPFSGYKWPNPNVGLPSVVFRVAHHSRTSQSEVANTDFTDTLAADNDGK